MKNHVLFFKLKILSEMKVNTRSLQKLILSPVEMMALCHGERRSQCLGPIKSAKVPS